jgi:glycosyltransferase involved in cell wall biosynthesis
VKNGTALSINGRYLAANATGVQRVARALVEQIARHRDDLRDLFGAGIRIDAPHNARAENAGGLDLRTVSVLTGQAWEQAELPLRARGALLLNLCNVAPIAVPGAVTMIHDAQAFSTPGSYSPTFRAWYRFLLPRFASHAARILTVSHFSAGELVKYGVASAERVTVVHNGVDHVLGFGRSADILQKLALDVPYVVALGSTQLHKNIAVLFRAFVAMPNIRLLLVGSATRKDFAAIGHEPPANVVFGGKVSDAELRALLENAVCFAMPSLTEGFGLPPLEAMLLGCPAVIAPCGALPEVCGNAALSVAPHDPAGWTRAITQLFTDPILRARMIAIGRQQAAAFTWSRAGTTLIGVLRDVEQARWQL